MTQTAIYIPINIWKKLLLQLVGHCNPSFLSFNRFNIELEKQQNYLCPDLNYYKSKESI